MTRRSYPTDLEDREWEKVEPFFYVSQVKGGRPLKHSKREVLDAIFYILRTGCQWRYLPHDFPPWKTVYEQFRRWKKQGVFEKMNNAMVKATRLHMGRNEYPSACIVDSQSVKTTEKGGSKAMTDIKANANDVAKRLGITTTTLYAYVNGDGSVKEAGQTILTLAS